LAIFYEILKCFKTIHNHKVTHYDIKCDNILIDFRADKHKNSAQQTDSEEASASSDTEILHADLQANLKDDFRITVGDFGECWMYAGD
jgi:serine/threonine protein kinase